MTYNQRLEPKVEHPFIVFIVGFQIHRIWKIHKWLPVLRAFNRMLDELGQHKSKGCMGYETWGGLNRTCIQYWQTYEQLLDYARDKSAQHFPAWFDFNAKIGRSGDVGLWHEVYVAKPGTFKAVYKNMPPFGLGKATELTSAKSTGIEVND